MMFSIIFKINVSQTKFQGAKSGVALNNRSTALRLFDVTLKIQVDGEIFEIILLISIVYGIINNKILK